MQLLSRVVQSKWARVIVAFFFLEWLTSDMTLNASAVRAQAFREGYEKGVAPSVCDMYNQRKVTQRQLSRGHHFQLVARTSDGVVVEECLPTANITLLVNDLDGVALDSNGHFTL